MTKALMSAAAAVLLAACTASDASEPAPAPAAPAPAPQVTETATAPATLGSLPAEPKLTVEAINDTLHVIFGPGGNIGVSSGPDGVVLVDDKFAANSEEILYRIGEITEGNGASSDLLFVINTHLHGDHSGSNAEMAAAGGLVMAHDNVRARMGTSYMNKAFGREQAAQDRAKWPVVTFSDRTSLHFNGVTAHALHTPSGHTDGDTIVHFVEPNVIHMGDNLFLNMFPFVDVDAGGNMQGMIDSHDVALGIADADTVIIPGHGPITDVAGLRDARDTLQAVLDRVRVRKDRGEGLQAIIDADPLADFAELESFIDRPAIITAAWRSLGGEFPAPE